jgi:hypothetical protein
MFSTFLQEVNATTGAAQSIPLSSPVTDMTVGITGAVTPVAEPTTACLLLSSLAGLIGIGRRNRNKGATLPGLPLSGSPARCP